MKWKRIVIIGIIVLLIVVAAIMINRKRVMDKFKETRLSENFTLDEFVRTSTGLDNIPDAVQIENIRRLVVNVLQPFRTAIGKPVHVNSGFRNKLVNAAVGGEDNSQHLAEDGEAAADITVDGMTNLDIINRMRALGLPYDQVIDEEKSSGSKWVHVSHRESGNRGNWLTARDGRYTMVATNYA